MKTIRFPALESILFLFLLILIIDPAEAIGQDLYFPAAGEDWDEKSPTDLGFDAEALEQAVQFAELNENSVNRDLRIAILEAFSREPYHDISGPVRERGGPAGMIVKDGYIAARWGDLDRVDMTFSVTKSYLSAVAGLAWDNRLIRSTDDRVAHYVWDNLFEGQHNSKITWEHLLNQSSDWSGLLFGIHDWADRPPREGGIDQWRNRDLNEPGTHFKYNDVRVNLLAYSLLQVWRKPLPQVLKEKIMDPIGASTTWRWYGYDESYTMIDGLRMQSVSGGGHHGGGIFISTWDQARFGLLFVRNGNWRGDQLISEQWIEKAVTPSAANTSYGYMWWLLNGNTHWEGVPDHVCYAAGFGGNYIIADRQNDLLIVLRWIDSSILEEFTGKVYKALSGNR